ncbi:hypothetical protein ACWJKU_13035 [Methylocaldum sp. MU1018]|jgi:hypothetical protein
MLLTRLRRRFQAFGADTRRWPKKPYGILRRLAGSPGCRAERAEAERLDRRLDLWRVEAPSDHLAQRICRQTLGLPQRPASVPASPDIAVWPFASYWPGVATFGFALVMGCLLGWYGSGTGGAAPEDWLNTAALSPIQEDFGER